MKGESKFEGQVDESSVSLRIQGDDLDPQEITDLLKFPPTVGRKKGETYFGRSESKRTAQTGIWILDSPKSAGDLDRHVRWILEVLPSDQTVWEALSANYQLDIFCGLFLEGMNRGTKLSAESMKILGERGIALSLDIYCLAPEDTEESC